MSIDIVFIDDEEDILNLVRLRFRKLAKIDGVNIHLFSNSPDFEDYIKTTNAQVVSVITDINMPNNKVLNTLEDQRSRFRFSLTYLCSAYDQSDYQEMISAHSIIHFFKKPLNIESIRDKILGDLEERGVKI